MTTFIQDIDTVCKAWTDRHPGEPAPRKEIHAALLRGHSVDKMSSAITGRLVSPQHPEPKGAEAKASDAPILTVKEFFKQFAIGAIAASIAIIVASFYVGIIA